MSVVSTLFGLVGSITGLAVLQNKKTAQQNMKIAAHESYLVSQGVRSDAELAALCAKPKPDAMTRASLRSLRLNELERMYDRVYRDVGYRMNECIPPEKRRQFPMMPNLPYGLGKPTGSRLDKFRVRQTQPKLGSLFADTDAAAFLTENYIGDRAKTIQNWCTMSELYVSPYDEIATPDEKPKRTWEQMGEMQPSFQEGGRWRSLRKSYHGYSPAGIPTAAGELINEYPEQPARDRVIEAAKEAYDSDPLLRRVREPDRVEMGWEYDLHDVELGFLSVDLREKYPDASFKPYANENELGFNELPITKDDA